MPPKEWSFIRMTTSSYTLTEINMDRGQVLIKILTMSYEEIIRTFRPYLVRGWVALAKIREAPNYLAIILVYTTKPSVVFIKYSEIK